MELFAFDVLARAVRDAKAREIRRIRHMEGAATLVAANGGVAAFALDGLRVELAKLACAEEVLTALAPREKEARALHPLLALPSFRA